MSELIDRLDRGELTARIRGELDGAELDLVPPRSRAGDPQPDWLLRARSPGKEQILAAIPYKAYADWLLDTLRKGLADE